MKLPASTYTRLFTNGTLLLVRETHSWHLSVVCNFIKLQMFQSHIHMSNLVVIYTRLFHGFLTRSLQIYNADNFLFVIFILSSYTLWIQQIDDSLSIETSFVPLFTCITSLWTESRIIANLLNEVSIIPIRCSSSSLTWPDPQIKEKSHFDMHTSS